MKKQIEAVQKINSQFESDALVDGSYNASIAVKLDANFNNLPESVTTTGNASLDSTIQLAIKGVKTQLEEKLRLRVQRPQRQLRKCHRQSCCLQVITHLEQLLMAAVQPHQILLGAQMELPTPAGSAGSTGATGGTTGGSAAASTVVTRGITKL